MTEPLTLVASLAVGVLLGVAFFRGLWITVEKIADSERPAQRLLSSLLLRFGTALICFYLLTRYGGWQAAVMAAIGFTVARVVIVRRAQQGEGESQS